VVADQDAAEGGGVSIVDFVLDGEEMTGITFFTFGEHGSITRLEAVWPEAYEPPSNRAHVTERF
jgi:hypothetical protein